MAGTKVNKYEKYSREELIDELEVLKRKKYGLVWDKKNSQEMLDTFVNWENMPENFAPKKFPVLKEVKKTEIGTGQDKPINLLIEGDNYHSLAILNFTHQSKIDAIYIDPPYNTGNKDFIYNDKFVDKEDPWRHSKWLSFMEKRLRLAHRLLKDTGIIFISIDDHEYAQLKLLCDEIFGEDNFIAQLVVQLNPRGRTLDKHFAKTFEYILVFAKNFDHATIIEPTKGEEMIAEYAKEDKKGKYRLLELRNRNPVFNRKNRPNLFYPIFVNPKDGSVSLENKNNYIEVYPRNSKNEDGCWTWSSEKVKGGIIDLVGKRVSTGAWRVYRKDYLVKDNGDIATTKEKALWLDKSINNENGKEVLRSMFNRHLFDFPKSVELIKKCINLSIGEEGTILDFFAGSGTTGQAILELNKEDGGSRKFILCTNNENNICTDVCYPRIEKVINGYKNSKGEEISGLGGNLKYYKTDFIGSDSTDKNKRDLVNKSAEMICIKEDIFDLVVDEKFDYKIYQKDNEFLGVIFNIDAINDFKKESEKHKGNFVVYCFSYTEVTPEKEFEGLKNKYVLKPIPAVILRIYLEIFKK